MSLSHKLDTLIIILSVSKYHSRNALHYQLQLFKHDACMDEGEGSNKDEVNNANDSGFFHNHWICKHLLH